MVVHSVSQASGLQHCLVGQARREGASAQMDEPMRFEGALTVNWPVWLS